MTNFRNIIRGATNSSGANEVIFRWPSSYADQDEFSNHLKSFARGNSMTVFADPRIDEKRWPWPWTTGGKIVNHNIEPSTTIIDIPLNKQGSLDLDYLRSELGRKWLQKKYSETSI